MPQDHDPTSTPDEHPAPDGAIQPILDAPLRNFLTERRAAGRAARKRRPRSDFAGWAPAAHRPDPVAVLESQIPSRLQQLIPERHRRMLESAFAFYRGGAAIMAADLGALPNTGLEVQLCGDAHLANFGLFGSPERALVFDLNDFDETHPGPWEWDVVRLAVSAVLLGRDRGWDDEVQHGLVVATVASYRTAMRSFAQMSNIDIWYSMMRVEQMASQVEDLRSRRRLERTVAKARANDTRRAVEKFTEVVGDRRFFRHQPPTMYRLDEFYGPSHRDQIKHQIYQLFGAYVDSLSPELQHLAPTYQLRDEALKVVGVGSVGTRCYVALARGRDENDLMILQIKEAQESVLAPYWTSPPMDNEGERVVNGQRLMQAASDPFLGFARIDPHDFYDRQFRDKKGSADLTRIRRQAAGDYLRNCGWTLARAHARSGDSVAIASYLGSTDRFDRAMVEFCRDYADQVQVDYEAFEAAANSGRIEVAPTPAV